MSAYYRELEKGELWQDGDLMFAQGLLPNRNIRLRPVTITEAPPEPPTHRVEDETWRVSKDEMRVEIEPSRTMPMGDSLATNPQTQTHDVWVKRAKRICAGQEALKLLEKMESGDGLGLGEVKRILAMLKEDGK